MKIGRNLEDLLTEVIRQSSIKRDYLVPSPVSEMTPMAEQCNRFALVPATQRLFPTAEKAAEYAAGIADSRFPRVMTAAEYLLLNGWRRSDDDVPKGEL